MKILIICALIAVAFVSVQGQACSGLEITGSGGLPDLNHNVSGRFFIEDTTTYCIEDFFYDGAGPDAFLYLYYPGDPVFIKGGGVITRVPGQDRVQFEVGRRYLGERLRFSVPEGHRTCDYGGFGIWCRYASQLFTVIYNMEANFSPEGGPITCTPSPGRAFLGSLSQTSNGISGDLFAVRDKQFTIRNFNYDGSGGAEVFFHFFPVGVTPSPNSTEGVSIPATALAETPVTNTTTDIVIPDNMDVSTCDFGSFTVWDRANSMFLAQVTFGDTLSEFFTNNDALADHDRALVHCDRPTTHPGVLVGELSRDDHGVEGTFYVQDDKTFYIQLFSYDARGSGAYLYYYRQGQAVEDSGHGYKINFSTTVSTLPTGISNSYKKITPFVVSLNNAADETVVNTCDVEWFTIWSEDDESHYTRIQIPQSVFTTDPEDADIAERTKVLCAQTTAVPTPRAGAPPTTAPLVGTLSALLIAVVAMLF